VRREGIGDFYKGLIQLAGAFVHVRKKRIQPALALLVLAEKNLGKYPELFQGLDLLDLRNLIARWRTAAESGVNRELARPQLRLRKG
jgi:hypothetical protein